ncbi:aromatic amino acid ammonia-lyase [Domibacillus indicus]|uniref:HAL/PAL/TAL family ammonia-lyase n=1 Tax=Domibacillus indicus TaxID=1437523 RepID=UPI002040847D|nr:aromatic amino acid ammonia-lyase [Domibacillus indicus]MCM3790022.1 aromatic amino acid ammonia-lyase [Domibacillus indicus]
MLMNHTKKVTLGNTITLEEFIEVVRFGAYVEFSEDYCKRVEKSQQLVGKWIEEGRVMYGVNTGFGALSKEIISSEETAQLQKNILLSHATSVGEPLAEEDVRATMLMILQNLGQGYSGVQLETLEMYRQFLNLGLIPWAPGEGSVGYLSPEAHMALVLIGEGKAYINGQLMPARKALEKAGLAPIVLSAKEGLALISGTTTPTGIGALALFDMLKAATAADIIGAMTVEVLKGTTHAFDDRLMSVRPHQEQRDTASNVRRILDDSMIAKKFINYRLQDALSLRAIPQLHGAAKKTLKDALKTFEVEINACTDNPILWPDEENAGALSGCNCDSSYVGIELDSMCIAATAIGKMSERRNNRLINGQLSEYPSFLIQKGGINSGLMIPQYTQAGLLNEMKILSHPATVDAIPTSADQEDYVAMGYNAAKKAREIAKKLEYVLAIELLSVYSAHQFIESDLLPGSASSAVLNFISQFVPNMEDDMYLHPHIEALKEFIHSGEIIKCIENVIGKLQ